ncbi:MAG TPA: hypothetical protein DCY20_04415 [Firmicutes bacterium]|nr:hypothetical protein [Bacillota bacterium]
MRKAKALKLEVAALYLAYRRDDVSWLAKGVAILVVGYALSPIDLIPDFIPLLGFLDDVILLPLGIYIALKLIPEEIMLECRTDAAHLFDHGKPKNYVAATVIIVIWISLISILFIKLFF